jgi:peptidyl-prolyl cis-trans isomerase SurA
MTKFTPVFLFLALFNLNAEARLVDKTLALVNSDVILQSDLGAFRKNYALRKEIDPFVALSGFSSEQAKDILDYLVQEKLVLQKTPPSDDEIEEEINAIQRNNKISREQLKEVLKSQGVNFDDYRRLMAVSVAKRRMIERELRPLAAVSDEDVKNHYYTDKSTKDRRKEQKLVLTYSLQQLILPNARVSEDATKRLRAGEDFDAVSSDLSSRGAETSQLTAISEDNMNPRIREAIQGLKVGETTKPIAAGSGYMILKITELGAPKDPSFEKEKEMIRSNLFQKALVNQLKVWTDRERAASYVHISAN